MLGFSSDTFSPLQLIRQLPGAGFGTGIHPLKRICRSHCSTRPVTPSRINACAFAETLIYHGAFTHSGSSPTRPPNAPLPLPATNFGWSQICLVLADTRAKMFSSKISNLIQNRTMIVSIADRPRLVGWYLKSLFNDVFICPSLRFCSLLDVLEYLVSRA